MSGLFALLSTATGLEALVGTRVYPLLLPNNPQLPAVTMQIVSSSVEAVSNTASGIQKTRIQFDCWGAKYSDASNTRDALIAAVNGYRGTLADGTYLQQAKLLQQIDFFEEQSLTMRCSVEFYLWAALN